MERTTPDQLEEKARTQPDSLMEAECRLLTHGYHIWSPHEALANSSIDWALEDTMANLEAVSALSTPEDYALSQAVRARSDFFAEERRKASKVTMANVARNFDKPCMWVSRLIDASKGLLSQLNSGASYYSEIRAHSVARIAGKAFWSR